MPGAIALLGGKPEFSRAEVTALWPVAGDEEITALASILRSGHWCRLKDDDWRTGECGLFEAEFRDFLGGGHVLGVANGTLAIELALEALGIGPGDEVIVQSATFFGTVTPIHRVGALPVFVDIDEHFCTVDPRCVEAAITPRTRAVLVAHLAGQPADLDELGAICAQHSLVLVEDCAQSTGSDWRDRRVGTFGDAATFSFQQDKQLQAGEGGAVWTRDPDVAGRVFALHQGFTMPGAPPCATHELGANMRITPWQAAILRCQLARLDDQIAHRLANTERLVALLEPDDVLAPVPLHEGVTRWSPHSMPFRYLCDNIGGLPRDTMLQALTAEGLPAFEGHLEPLYRRPIWQYNDLAYRNSGCPAAERVSRDEHLAILQPFLLGPGEWMERMVEALRRIQANASSLRSATA